MFFVDDGYRAVEELIEGENSPVVQRRLTDGTAYRIVKVPYQPEDLEQQLDRMGWRVKVHSTSGPFYWGAGTALARRRCPEPATTTEQRPRNRVARGRPLNCNGLTATRPTHGICRRPSVAQRTARLLSSRDMTSVPCTHGGLQSKAHTDEDQQSCEDERAI